MNNSLSCLIDEHHHSSKHDQVPNTGIKFHFALVEASETNITVYSKELTSKKVRG